MAGCAVLEGRRAQFVAEVAAAQGIRRREAAVLVDTAVDRWVWYAGWADKLAGVLGAANPVAGRYLCYSVPEPTGVVGVLAPPRWCGTRSASDHRPTSLFYRGNAQPGHRPDPTLPHLR